MTDNTMAKKQKDKTKHFT